MADENTEGWEVRRLKTVVNEVHEIASPKGQFYVGMENIVSWCGTFVETEISVDGDCKCFKKGDLLLKS